MEYKREKGYCPASALLIEPLNRAEGQWLMLEQEEYKLDPMNNLPCYIWDSPEGSKAEFQEVNHWCCILRWEIWDCGAGDGAGGRGKEA